MPIPAKILVVDDQALVRRTLRSLLVRQPHWQVYEAHDGLAALERAREIQPDVLVMDIVMPNMSGIAAVYELRRVVPQAKVVLISFCSTSTCLSWTASPLPARFVEFPPRPKSCS